MSGLELNKVSPRPGESGQNSMEYWDYSVEIECLKGPQGLSSLLWIYNQKKKTKKKKKTIKSSTLKPFSCRVYNEIFCIGMDCADVEAAAELGRTLLERNRDLESTIRHQQVVLDDQTQEMEVNLTL